MEQFNYFTAVMKNYAGFTGRARRSEFWYFYLFSVIISVVLSIVGSIIGFHFLSTIWSLAVLVPTLAAGARRLHDTGRSGWWQLIGLTGIGIIVLIVFYVQDSNPGENQFGPNPKGQ